MKRVGPELKMPDLKSVKEMRAPAWAVDLYCDMRDRRLLPLVALVVVAIVAVPFLLGGSEEGAVPVEEDVAAGQAAIGAEPAQLTVVEARPGLRDYKERLKGRSPTDPFVQKYTALPGSAKLESTVSESTGSESTGSESGGGGGTTTEGPEPAPSGDSTSSPGGGSGGSDGSGGGAEAPKLYEFVVDVQIAHTEPTADGKRKMSKPKLHRQVRPLTKLPGDKAPVVTTMGVNLRNGRAMFLVSDDATKLEGDFSCVSRTPGRLCELLEIQPGFVLEVVYGANDARFRYKVTKVDAVPARKTGDGRSKQKAAREARTGFSLQGVGG